MHTIPPHVVRLLFDDSGAKRSDRARRGRSDMQPRRRSARARNERH
jgi:hypothetical protein